MKKQVAYLQKLFYDIWNDFGSVYLLVGHSAGTTIGRRGFSEEERKQGLVLVFNNRTSAELNWDEEGNLACVLAFGAKRENVVIHHDDLLGVFSQDAGVQFLRSDMQREPAAKPAPEDGREDGQVVSLSSFRKRRAE